mgnify:CR=1 FL=1
MAKSGRIFGRDTVVVLVFGGKVLKELQQVKSFSTTHNIDIVKEQYLGFVAPQADNIFQGTDLKLEMDWGDDTVMENLYLPLIRAAADRTKSAKINVTSTFIFSTGKRQRLQYPGCSYGNLPANISGRDKFVSGGLDLFCDSIPTLL